MNQQVEIRPALPENLPEWMRLVEKVRWNFPGLNKKEELANFRKDVSRAIQKGNALCAWYQGRLVGVVLFSPQKNMLCFLAVDPGYRHRGIATRLLEEMMGRLDPDRNVTAFAFPAENAELKLPNIYEAFGFRRKRTLYTLGCPVWRFVRRNGSTQKSSSFRV